MAKLDVTKGFTSLITHIFIQDTSRSDGGGLTGLAYNSAGLTCYYIRPGGTGDVSVSLNNITTLGTYAGDATHGALKEVDGVGMPGVYEFHLPNNAVASGANQVVIMLRGATNMAPLPLEIQLPSYDPNNATSLGLSDIDAAISSRLAASGYTAPDNTDIATLVGRLTSGRAANLDNLDAAVSSRLASSGYVAPDNTDIATILTNVGTLLSRVGQDILFDGSGNVFTDARVVSDKTGYSLSSGEHTNIITDVESGLTGQGYTTARAGEIDTILADLGTLLAGVVVAAYASGQDPASLLLSAVVEAAAGPAPSFTVSDILKQVLGMSAGATSGMGTSVGTVQNPSGTKNRFVSGTDASGDRTPVSWDNT